MLRGCHFEYLNLFQNAKLYFSFSMSKWLYNSYIDSVSHFSIPFSLYSGMADIQRTSGWNLMGIAHYAIRLVVPTNIYGRVGLCARYTFFSFSVFVDFLNCVFWHLWYIIRKLLKSSFICTEASFSGLFVWKLRGFKVFQNLPIIVGTCSTSSCKFRLIQEYLEEHLNKSL